MDERLFKSKQSTECSSQVGLQIGKIFQPNTDSDKGGILCGICAQPVLQQGFNAPKRCGSLN